jgi:putative sterol carrier protein
MPTPFATDAWIKALMLHLNESPTYREAARDWEGDFYFVVSGSDGHKIYLYMDLWHGICRSAYAVEEPTAKAPEFVIEAEMPVWRRVVEKKLDPIQGLVMRQLKLQGPMMKVMRAPRAATELVMCCTRIDTEWPN